MNNGLEQSGSLPAANPERRLHCRIKPSLLTYIALGAENGGVVLNVSEGGLAIQAVMELADEQLSKIRLQLLPTSDWVTTKGCIVWRGESRKVAGIRFLNLPESVRVKIRNWICLEGSDQEFKEEPLSLWENLNPLPESPTGQDLEGSQQSIFQGVKDAPTEGFWAAFPPGAHSTGSRQNALIPSQTNVAFSPSSIFGISREDTDVQQRVRSRGSMGGWKIPAIVISTAAISLALGISIGNRSLQRWLRKTDTVMQSSTQGVTQQTIAMKPGATHAIRDESSSSIQNALERPVNDMGVYPQQSARESPVQVDRLEAENGLWITAPPPGAPSLSVTMPLKILNASSSFEISSQRSVVVPPLRTEESSHRKERLQMGDLISFIEPTYPVQAGMQKANGAAKLRATIGPDGKVEYVGLLSGSPFLGQAAIDAISKWRYKPTLFEGQPVETVDEITMVYRTP